MNATNTIRDFFLPRNTGTLVSLGLIDISQGVGVVMNSICELSDAASLADRRFDYKRGGLVESEASADPFAQFELWIAEAIVACEGTAEEPHAMSLATVGPDIRPSVRTVLLKGFDRRGFVWFTNYESRKGTEITTYVAAAVNFRWGALERQVSARGLVTRVDAVESDAYFASRPRGSQIGAIVSPQSRVIESREPLETAAAALDAGPDEAIVRPAHWGGFRLVPDEIEFWQGRSSRLHDRLRYRLNATSGDWVRERLAP
jgi:pyridoxamine 5'-phosphate oxidase